MKDAVGDRNIGHVEKALQQFKKRVMLRMEAPTQEKEAKCEKTMIAPTQEKEAKCEKTMIFERIAIR